MPVQLSILNFSGLPLPVPVCLGGSQPSTINHQPSTSLNPQLSTPLNPEPFLKLL
jgi:hypothetical protein